MKNKVLWCVKKVDYTQNHFILCASWITMTLVIELRSQLKETNFMNNNVFLACRHYKQQDSFFFSSKAVVWNLQRETTSSEHCRSASYYRSFVATIIENLQKLELIYFLGKRLYSSPQTKMVDFKVQVIGPGYDSLKGVVISAWFLNSVWLSYPHPLLKVRGGNKEACC